MKVRLFTCLALLSFAFVPSMLFGQAAEINPYGGFYWPGNNSGVGKFEKNQIFGVRGGGYVTPNFEIGGNWAWSNHFQPKSDNEAASLAGALGFPQGRMRYNLLEAEFTYNFSKGSLGGSIRPYLVAGGGALITKVKDPDQFTLNTNSFTVTQVDPVTGLPFTTVVFEPNDVVDSGDTFFTFSYGGGVKFNRVWGPLGFFGDFRGRTIPNFFNGRGTNWPELSAGLTFSWGER
jgi:hypothetical protein